MIRNDQLFIGENADYYSYIENKKGWRQKTSCINEEGLMYVSPFSAYTDRANDWHDGKKVIKKVENNLFGNWSESLYVAPTFGNQQWANVARSKPLKFIFLDVGRWKGKSRDFGLIWGRNVYLCSYNPSRYSLSYSSTVNEKRRHYFEPCRCNRKQGIDYELFSNFSIFSDDRIIIQAYTYADWGDDNEYNWERIYVIIPDLHLMSVQTSKIWYSYMPPGYFNLDTEVDLMYFVHDLIRAGGEIGKDKIHVIQIGDCYDLWVGLGRNDKKTSPNTLPLFKENENEHMEIHNGFMFWDDKGRLGYRNSLEYLSNAIQQIQIVTKEELISCQKDWLLQKDSTFIKYGGYLKQTNKYLNPAEVALRKLQEFFGKNNLTYIYGNHDNYLIDDSLTNRAGLYKREAYYSYNYENEPTLFVEHGHRMEANFPLPVPKNHDGCITGFKSTNELYYNIQADSNGLYKEWPSVYKEYPDDWAGWHDQPCYREEFARFYLGKKSKKNQVAPNIFVIGHTHMPQLYNIEIRPASGDPYIIY